MVAIYVVTDYWSSMWNTTGKIRLKTQSHCHNKTYRHVTMAMQAALFQNQLA